MQRYVMRMLVAVLTFTIGVATPSIVKRILHPSQNFSDCVISFDYIPPSSFDSAEDVDEIYRRIVSERFTHDGRDDMITLLSESTGFPMCEKVPENHETGHAETRSFEQFVSESMPEVETRTLLDYLAKNRTPAPLQVSNLGLEYVLLNPEDLSSGGPHFSWSRFYKKFPRSTGIVFFSQIGFNPAHDQAFVYAGKRCEGLCGGGYYILLGKENGKWVIVKQVSLWAS